MKAVAPGAWLGLLGGGQLGRMFTMAAQSMGYRVVVVDPGRDSPAGSVADDHLCADYLDPTRSRNSRGAARVSRPSSRTSPPKPFAASPSTAS